MYLHTSIHKGKTWLWVLAAGLFTHIITDQATSWAVYIHYHWPGNKLGCLHTLSLTRQQAGLFTYIITDQATSWAVYIHYHWRGNKLGCLHTLSLTRQQAGLFTHIITERQQAGLFTHSITDQATSWAFYTHYHWPGNKLERPRRVGVSV